VQSFEAEAFGRREPADGDLGAGHGGAVAVEFGSVLQDAGKDQVGGAAGVVVGPEGGQVLEHQVVVPLAGGGPLPHQRVEVDSGVGDLELGQGVVDLRGHRGLA